MSDNSQKYALECLRLAADFTQLASDVHGRALEIHLLGMAKILTERAEKGPDGNRDPETN